MQTGLRKVLMASLLAAFVGQTTLVYADDTADRTPPLTGDALRGRELWHEHNCQACHQIYGFGGFLGPDLTNAGSRLTQSRYDEILTQGNAQMPAFHLEPGEINAIKAFLVALDKTGIGVPRATLPPEPAKVYDALTELTANADSNVQQGLQQFRAICAACHTPLCATPLGPNTAPDLSDVCDRLDNAAIAKVIAEGRPLRGMPPWPLGDVIGEQLVPFLEWLRDNRATLRDSVGDATRSGLPWWEFK